MRINLSWLLAARLQGWADETHPGRLRGGAPADHRAGVALRNGPCAEDDPRAPRRAGRHRGARAPRATRSAPTSGARPTSSMCSSSAAPASTSATTTRARPSSRTTASAPPAYSMGGFTPSTVPGCRAPHFWLRRRALAVRRLRPRLHAAALRPPPTTRRPCSRRAATGHAADGAGRRRGARPRSTSRAGDVPRRPACGLARRRGAGRCHRAWSIGCAAPCRRARSTDQRNPPSSM